MLKKVILTALCGASALSMIAANAATSGVYVSGQLGYAQTHMKGKTAISDIEKLEFPGSEFIDTAGSKDNLANNGLAGRLAIGYQFNPNFAVEVGYLQLKQGKSGDITINDGEKADLANINLTLNQRAFDVAAKGIIPLACNFNIYGKLGVAYLSSVVDANGKFNATDKTPEINGKVNVNDLIGLNKSEWAPEAAIGVSYDITPNVSIDTSWTHIHTIGKQRAGNVDFFAAGLTYNFG